MKLTPQDRIWNRAAMEMGGSAPQEGDIALTALLLVHGMVMNGGIEHALVAVNAEEYTTGIEGFRYFNLFDVASVLEKAMSATETDYEQLDAEYGNIVSSDSKLVKAFQVKLLSSPEAFSPLEDSNV